ncbi:MAG: hypothetical protein ABIX44_05570, partial [Cryobacterium sp.]
PGGVFRRAPSVTVARSGEAVSTPESSKNSTDDCTGSGAAHVGVIYDDCSCEQSVKKPKVFLIITL